MTSTVTQKFVIALGALLMVSQGASAQRPFTLTAIIRDSATGRPVPGAVVQMASATRQYTGRSDEVGEASLRDFERGNYRVLVRRIGYRPLAIDVDVQNDKRQEFRVAPLPQMLGEVRVRGTGTGIYGIVGTSGGLEPIAGARVQVAGAKAAVQTDSAGAFFVELKDPGTFMIRVSRDGFSDQVFPLEVKRNQVADASTLLDSASNGGSIPDGLWKDFDSRLMQRSVNNSVVVTGSDMRRNRTSFLSSLELSGALTRYGLKVGPVACIFVNGSPVPAYPINSVRVEEVTAVEVYAGRVQRGGLLEQLDAEWPPLASCSDTGRRVSDIRAPEVIRYILIWTKR
jgi:hypothetical protein